MGSFADKMFGKKQSIDPNKINAFMKPYDDLVNQQQGIANDLMNPDSLLSINKRNLLRRENFDLMGQQNQDLQANLTMGNMSAGQIAANQKAMASSARAEAGNRFQNQEFQQYNQGLGMLGQVTGLQKDIGERGANTYVQGVNAANASRAGNMKMFGTGLAMLSDVSVKENIELVGKSPKGTNVYEFDYIDKSYAKGRYKGVIAQEVPEASFLHDSGYLAVNYDKLDVDFERIK